ncbi:ribonuclease H-like domain-containing protein, partial [Helcococcus ovis]
MYNLKKSINIKNLDENSIILDIETNGVSRIHSQVYVIGFIYQENFYQFAVENDKEEEKLLNEIFPFLDNKNIITFNGKNFDIPFLKARYEFYGLSVFEEKSQFDIYRYFISNRLIMDFRKFSLQDIEKFNELERHENFEIDDDVKFYQEIENIDISKVLLHNQYDVINTEKLLNLIKKIEESKKLIIHIKKEEKLLKISNLIIEKDFLKINIETTYNFIDYAFENEIYTINWTKNGIDIKIKVLEGYVSDNIKAYVYINTLNKIKDESNYNLQDEFIVIFDTKYYLNNIK